MDTVEYIKQNLMKELSLKANSVSVTAFPTIDHLRLTVSWTIPAAAITRSPTAVTKLYNPRATSKYRLQSEIRWDDLLTTDSADRVLKGLLEAHCSVYNNDEHTRYYDPTLLLEPVQAPVRQPKPVYRRSGADMPSSDPRFSDRPDILKLVKDQIEFDEQWEASHRAKNT